MQRQPENDLIYLLTMLEAAGKINIYSAPFTTALDFFTANDQLHFNASLLLIATIGDQVSKISVATKEKYPNVPWQYIRGMRNRIVHDYNGIDFELTFQVVTTEIPGLILALQEITYNELKAGVLSYQEMEVARNSSWYRHVDFNSLI